MTSLPQSARTNRQGSYILLIYRQEIFVQYIEAYNFLNAPRICMNSCLTKVLLFAAIANIGCHIFTYANEKFANVFVSVFTKSDATGLHFGKPSSRLENCHATVSLILCCWH